MAGHLFSRWLESTSNPNPRLSQSQSPQQTTPISSLNTCKNFGYPFLFLFLGVGFKSWRPRAAPVSLLGSRAVAFAQVVARAPWLEERKVTIFFMAGNSSPPCFCYKAMGVLAHKRLIEGYRGLRHMFLLNWSRFDSWRGGMRRLAASSTVCLGLCPHLGAKKNFVSCPFVQLASAN